LILEGFGNEDRAFQTIGLNLMAVGAAASGIAPAAILFGRVAAIYDVGLFLRVRYDCIQAVYGQ
jgi:hypothetical protein